ncbi:MAG: hypothetical protein ABIK44_06790 [candidate division WOR-3 bacterium]
MRLRRLELTIIAALFIGLSCGPRAVKPAQEHVVIYLVRSFPRKAISHVAAMVQQARRAGPCLWLVIDEDEDDRLWAAFSDEAAEAAFWNASRVDAILPGRKWLRFGPDGLRRIADRLRCYLLAANLTDTLGTALAHPFMVRRLGPVTIGITGLFADSEEVLIRQQGIRFQDPEFTVGKTVPLLRMRADLIGVMVKPGTMTGHWNIDLTIGSESGKEISLPVPERWDRVRRLELLLVGGRVVDCAASEDDWPRVERDAAVFQIGESLRKGIDSLSAVKVVESKVAVGPQVLTRALVQAILEDREIDGVLYDSLFATDTLRPGIITCGQLVSVLRDPERWAVLELSGREIKALTQEKLVKAEWRKGAFRPRLLMNRSYRCLASVGFLRRHPEFAAGGFRLSERQFWQTAAEVLRKAGRR